MIIQLFAPTNLPFSIFSEHLRQRARPLLLYSANALYSCSSAVSIGFQCPSTTVKGGAIFALKFVHVPLLSSGGLGCQGVKKMKLNLENSRELLIGISESRMPWIASPFFCFWNLWTLMCPFSLFLPWIPWHNFFPSHFHPLLGADLSYTTWFPLTSLSSICPSLFLSFLWIFCSYKGNRFNVLS